MTIKNKNRLFWLGIFLLLIPGLVHAYLLMPFPGSQNLEAITVSYYLEKMVLPLRILGCILVIWYLISFFNQDTRNQKAWKLVMLFICAGIYYVTDVQYKAEKMFEEPHSVVFANALQNKVPQGYVILGVVHNGVAKAYPLIYLGYHHKVQDNVGTEPVLVTYCTMCRTGRVYSPVVNGKRQNFRLVGARHYNAVVEDESTGTWWYQATGKAAVGELKGASLKEVNYEQTTLEAWLRRHPGSLIMQPDRAFANDYADLKNYDNRQPVDKDSLLKNKDSLIRKSWVIGVALNNKEKAYEWRQLYKQQILNDSLGKTNLLIGIEKDSLTFHVWNSTVNNKPLHFNLNSVGIISDTETGSLWDWDGFCTDGKLKGKQLTTVQAYQEYWHSWQHFHPATKLWHGNNVILHVAKL
ncbi:DUF3179 domain-containing (seleno)protein [Mucilaginibacter polytrichastri]|uniref:DUF3179 domain-containing protein n=1 Tax=Mucilaginibacter polytrichastri TaxID=1302689 RepID=A0A1Q5ZTL9_9SPHI|nr:DUF3179 domain-containing (seleno)protein [Mucilaginibacter polytrichastri]OKS85111.1 hypothetical protein RG47T_0550 [Mucilaginibacter polytrichastri]SFS44364.1 Protein of unknown function [Mucilaginibacter polytrichastri]